jgi:hypothetical protein
MTEQPTPEPPVTEGGEPGAGMPRWVPVLIGLVLVSIAALAVYTGLRYRESDTLTRHVTPQRDRTHVPAPPGEPGAGASLVMHGREGEDTTPAAGEPVEGESRAVISGGPGGVSATVRMWARRGMILSVEPPDAMVHVNGMLIGQARQFDTADEVYDFAAPGSYTVRVVAPSGAEKTFVVTAADEAQDDVATIAVKLK